MTADDDRPADGDPPLAPTGGPPDPDPADPAGTADPAPADDPAADPRESAPDPTADITLTRGARRRRKHTVTAARNGAVLHRDTIDLDADRERQRFARAVVRALMPDVPQDDWPAAAIPLITDRLLALADAPADPPPGGDDDDGGDDSTGGIAASNTPTIIVSDREHWTNRDAVASLARAEGLYQRAGLLVSVVEAPAVQTRLGAVAVARPAGPMVVTHDHHSIRERLTACARYITLRQRDGNQEAVPANPPPWCTRAVIARRYWPTVPPLVNVVAYPVLLPGGRVLTRHGYDADSGLYLHDPTGTYARLAIPDRPTRGDAFDAAAKLTELVSDFPFVAEYHRAAWVAGLLTPPARYAFAGPAPLTLLTANTPATGKSLLADLVAQIVTGGDFARASYSNDPAETRKLITTFVAAGDPLTVQRGSFAVP